MLMKVFMCYSREIGKEKEYTADKIRTKRVRSMLSPILKEPNAHIFICGSANMAEDAKRAFSDISSPGCFDALTEEGRLHCDVFGALSSGRKKASRVASYSLIDALEEDLLDDEVEEFNMSLTFTERPNLRDMFGTRSSSCSALVKDKCENDAAQDNFSDLFGKPSCNDTLLNHVSDNRKNGKPLWRSMVLQPRGGSSRRKGLMGVNEE